jgi:uncharacterized protein
MATRPPDRPDKPPKKRPQSRPRRPEDAGGEERPGTPENEESAASEEDETEETVPEEVDDDRPSEGPPGEEPGPDLEEEGGGEAAGPPEPAPVPADEGAPETEPEPETDTGPGDDIAEEPVLVGATAGPSSPASPATPVTRNLAAAVAAAAPSKGASSVPQYLSPGVYVEEIPSAVKPIAGVGTSTAAFIGIYPDPIHIPYPNPNYDPTGRTDEAGTREPYIYRVFPNEVPEDQVARFDQEAGDLERQARENRNDRALARRARDASDRAIAAREDRMAALRRAKPGEIKLCTSFTDFERFFGTFSDVAGERPPARPAGAPAGAPGGPPLDPRRFGHRELAHAVYGFFNNGGTRCWVVRFLNEADLSLRPLEGIDEIALVAAPGLTAPAVQQAIVAHCELLGDRFAILDSDDIAPDENPTVDNIQRVDRTDYGAIYFPRIRVFDVSRKRIDPAGDGQISIPPSGHVAGIYARVDTIRGVHKAPANEVIRGALGVTYPVSRAIQDGLNPDGVNCIRDINGNIRVWGARTIGGDHNADYKYINVRRLMLFLRESIDEGTQWVVFEPNDRALWAKIERNVTAFLLTVWRDGALFGSTPAEAFYVRCDDTTNPPEVRDLGRVITEIGVAPVKPAEFVIFRITQWSGPQGR